MKLKNVLMLVASVAVMASCGGSQKKGKDEAGKKDSGKEQAKEQKEQKDSKKKAADASEASESHQALKKVATINLMANAISETAQKKASNKKVKEFAKKVNEGHGKAREKLQSIVKSKDITLPDEMPKAHKERIQKLESLEKGAEYDKLFMSTAVDGHEKAVKQMKTVSEKYEDKAIKTWAKNMVPKLENLLENAKEVKGGLKESA